MLPKHYYIDDEKWIISQLSMLPVAYIKKASDAYSDVYFGEVGDGELLQIQNARTTANTRLRKYVQAVSEKLSASKTDS